MQRPPAIPTSHGLFSLLTSRLSDTYLDVYHVRCSHRSFAKVGQLDMKPHRGQTEKHGKERAVEIRASQFVVI
jgi:hypothetical protein